jgi:hypothetical protein
MTRHRFPTLPHLATALAFLFVACATSAGAADAVSGTARLNAQSVTLAHGIGFLDAKKQGVTLGLFAAAPSAADAAAAAKGGIDDTFGVNSPAKGAYVLLKLSFPAGAARAEHVGVCEINFYNFADSPLQTMWLGDDQCGVTELGGDLRPGGVVHGKLKGGSKETSGKTYAWDLAFTTTLQPGK